MRSEGAEEGERQGETCDVSINARGQNKLRFHLFKSLEICCIVSKNLRRFEPFSAPLTFPIAVGAFYPRGRRP